ncbi:preprotein translocase subunit YajC [Humibacter albus]|uniref:preprotein translocase subunit YajC n=1 Tax=Humibacter albus TaxID=427754 RepID=UPI0003B5A675|nr:preprotein translocase subunit YajC [Humibacter albus]
MDQNVLTIVMVVVLAALIFFMFRSSRRRQKQQQDLQKQVVPGASVMTNFGVFGTIVSIDEESNKVKLETGPGQILTVHRQTIGRVETTPDAVEESTPEVEVTSDDAATSDEKPQFGERIEKSADASAAAAQPNKTDE